jgi:hypothetical protein
MTDRFHSLVVVLEKDIREDDAQAIINAIQMVKGVLTVEGLVADPTSLMAYARARSDLQHKLFSTLHDTKGSN